MLEKVITDLKANSNKTLDDISAGAYNHEDFYLFCSKDGKFTAHGANRELVGQSVESVKDNSGDAIGPSRPAVPAGLVVEGIRVNCQNVDA
jgi:hypothetical protein